jgi:ribosomal protein S10
MKIYLECDNARTVDRACRMLAEVAKGAGQQPTGLWPLESSASGLHRRLLIVPNPGPKVLRAWSNVELPESVTVVMRPLLA